MRLRDLIDDVFGVIGTKPKERTDDLPLFGKTLLDQGCIIDNEDGSVTVTRKYPHYSPHAQTSTAAFESAKPKALSKKKRILLLLEASGGMTRSEIAWSTKFSKDTCNARLSELRAENKIHEAGVRDGEKLCYPGPHPK